MELLSAKKLWGRGMKVNTGFGCYRQEWSTHAQNEGSRGGCALGRAITKTVENCCSGSTSCEILVRRLQQVGDSRTRIGTDWGRASHWGGGRGSGVSHWMVVRCRVDTVKAFAIILLIRPLFLASHSIRSIWSADNWVSGTGTWDEVDPEFQGSTMRWYLVL